MRSTATRRSRRSGTPLTCMMIGIDHSRAIRQEHGSVLYDYLQVQVAQRLQLALHGRDILLRYGDEAFVLLTEAESCQPRNPDFDEAMEALAGMSYAAYRRLAEHPGLVDYYQAASPVEELVRLKIGSRPARRFGAAVELVDLGQGEVELGVVRPVGRALLEHGAHPGAQLGARGDVVVGLPLAAAGERQGGGAAQDDVLVTDHRLEGCGVARGHALDGGAAHQWVGVFQRRAQVDRIVQERPRRGGAIDEVLVLQELQEIVFRLRPLLAPGRQRRRQEVAVVALREYISPSSLSTAALTEVIAEFRAVTFSSMLSSLSLSASISATTSSRVADCANTVNTFDDTVAADTIDAIMNVTKIFDIILLRISVSPNSLHL